MREGRRMRQTRRREREKKGRDRHKRLDRTFSSKKAERNLLGVEKRLEEGERVEFFY